jgi:hypothetical protein
MGLCRSRLSWLICFKAFTVTRHDFDLVVLYGTGDDSEPPTSHHFRTPHR